MNIDEKPWKIDEKTCETMKNNASKLFPRRFLGLQRSLLTIAMRNFCSSFSFSFSAFLPMPARCRRPSKAVRFR